MQFTIVREANAGGGKYLALSETGAEAGYMTFRAEKQGEIIIDHTKVHEDFGGQGVGRLLLEKAIADARREGAKILPICSYALHYFEKHQNSLADIWIE